VKYETQNGSTKQINKVIKKLELTNFNTKDNSLKFDFWIKFGIEKDFEKIL
jgi:hypothetical protein